jgi:hypothetical protein
MNPMNRSTAIGAGCGLVAWLLFLVGYGFFYGANDEFFKCERYHLGQAMLLALELAVFVFPVTLGVLVVGGVAGAIVARIRRSGR